MVAEQRHLPRRELRGGAGCSVNQTKVTEVVGKGVVERREGKAEDGSRYSTSARAPFLPESHLAQDALQVARIL